jgi:hypothetical protein
VYRGPVPGGSDCGAPDAGAAAADVHALALVPGLVRGVARLCAVVTVGEGSLRGVWLAWLDVLLEASGPAVHWVGCTALPPGPSALPSHTEAAAFRHTRTQSQPHDQADKDGVGWQG